MSREPWHLDRKVPLALIATLLLQTAGIVWWAAGIDNRVAGLEQSGELQRGFGDRLVKLEAVKDDVARRLDRIEEKLDRALERRGAP